MLHGQLLEWCVGKLAMIETAAINFCSEALTAVGATKTARLREGKRVFCKGLPALRCLRGGPASPFLFGYRAVSGTKSTVQPEAEGKASRFVLQRPLFWSGNTYLADGGAWGPHCRYGVISWARTLVKQTSITPTSGEGCLTPWP